MQQRASPRPSAAACFPVSPPLLTTRRRVLRANTAWSTTTAPARRSSPRPATCLPLSSLSTAPERRLLATVVPYQVGHVCRWRYVLFQVCFRNCFQVFHLYIAYVASICFSCFIRMFHVFHLYVLCVSSCCCKMI
jgi:hypothetical protein